MSSIHLTNELPQLLLRNYIARVPTYLQSKPAVGKTESVNAFADKMKAKLSHFEYHQFYAPTMSPIDIMSAAPDPVTGELRVYANAALPNAYKTPDAEGVIFIDEMPNADPAALKLLQKYVNGEDMSGVLRKPKGIMVIAAGNRLEDKSGVQQHGRAFLSRFEQVNVYNDADSCLKYAIDHDWHLNVITFFKENPALIDNYTEVFEAATPARDGQPQQNAQRASRRAEEGRRGIWANMRSWKRISDKEKANDQMARSNEKFEVTMAELAGNIGQAVGNQYDGHRKALAKLATYEDVITDPTNAKLPTKMDEQYAMAMLCAMRCKTEHLDQIKTYGQRLPLEQQAVLLRQLNERTGAVNLANPAYTAWILDPQLVKLLGNR